jgi:hypothetical protein
MSKYEWRKGRFWLPKGEGKVVAERLIAADAKTRATATERVNKFWDQMERTGRKFPPSTPGSHFERDAIDWYEQAYTPSRWSSQAPDSGEILEAFDDAVKAGWTASGGFKRPRPNQITAALEQRFGKPPKLSKTMTFRAGEGVVTINGDRLSYDVPENNHAVDHADGTPVGAEVLAQINRIGRTRGWGKGEGGYWTGNDEYAEENGAGAWHNGVGPVGEGVVADNGGFQTDLAIASMERTAAARSKAVTQANRRSRELQKNRGVCGEKNRDGTRCKNPRGGCYHHG